MYTPANASFFYIKVGYKGVHITGTCFPDGTHRRKGAPHCRIKELLDS